MSQPLPPRFHPPAARELLAWLERRWAAQPSPLAMTHPRWTRDEIHRGAWPLPKKSCETPDVPASGAPVNTNSGLADPKA